MKRLLFACTLLCLTQSSVRAADPMARVNALRSQVTDLEHIENIFLCRLRIQFYTIEQRAQDALEEKRPSISNIHELRKTLPRHSDETRIKDCSFVTSFSKDAQKYLDALVVSDEHRRELTEIVKQSKNINPDEVAASTLRTMTHKLDFTAAQHQETSDSARSLRKEAFAVLIKRTNDEPFLRAQILVNRFDKLQNPPKDLSAEADDLYRARFDEDLSLDYLNTWCNSFEKKLDEHTATTS